ncbi:hypothetical protein [Caldivirga sp. MU80]|uniref:hypothetical protein n=1 Tax=Caldivirga sp. MU80 TaxID=1650354 RepID=UPI00082952B5|nr:hypothetical protein [Caldivirga sp. MU80]
MAECQPKIPEVNYRNEDWWREFFIKDFAEFYSSLKGLLNAKSALLSELSGDLAQVLADQSKRDLALRILLGGVKDECVEQGKIERGCIPPGSAAHFYRYVLGVGLGKDIYSDLSETTRLVQIIGRKGLEKIGDERLGMLVSSYSSEPPPLGTISEINKLAGGIYNRLRRVIPELESANPVNYDYRDLVKAFEDFLNKGIKLLPLYNPFTFFIQSLRSTPKPYLKIMYCDELFSDPIRNLMSKYGIGLVKILDPNLGISSLDDELAVIGHEDGSVGDLLTRLIWGIYELTYELNQLGYRVNDELKEYVNVSKYRGYLDEFASNASDIIAADVKLKCGHRLSLEAHGGLIRLMDNGRYDVMSFNESCDFRLKKGKETWSDTIDIRYERFLEVFSQLLFLGVAWISKTDRIMMYVLH